MYKHIYDHKSGGILLTSSDEKLNNELRPVFAPELDILGFHHYWNYSSTETKPYMWAEANQYYYRGKKVASISGGSFKKAPVIELARDEEGNVVEPEMKGRKLIPIDVKQMIEDNAEMLRILEQSTVKRIKAIYEKYKNELDCFHVAFSGGKDSIVLLDLVKKTLPAKSYIVIFSDTGMELEDTYAVVEKTRQECERDEIPFFVAKSKLDVEESWKLFGPPARKLRWCCSVHKSSPQTILLREISGKQNFCGLDFVGVRASESNERSKYSEENFGKKQKGQYSHHSILRWNSAEVWLYIFANQLAINESYKKGLHRVGCALCPMSPSGVSAYIKSVICPDQVKKFYSFIEESYLTNPGNPSELETYLYNDGWANRLSGDRIKGNVKRYSESHKNGFLEIEIIDPKSEWFEWIKPLGLYALNLHVEKTKKGWIFSIPENAVQEDARLGKRFRIALKKSAYCVGCGVCEANCKHGSIHFVNNKVRIDDCKHCFECFDISAGCLMYNSQKIINVVQFSERGKQMSSEEIVLNKFNGHAPTEDKILEFFGKESLNVNGLSEKKYGFFKQFLRDAELIDETGQFSKLAKLLSQNCGGWNNTTTLGIVLINLVANNTEFHWWIKNLVIGQLYSKDSFDNMVKSFYSDSDKEERTLQTYCTNMKTDFGIFIETSLGQTLRMGTVFKKGRSVVSLGRTKCVVDDLRVVLYGLYKYAELNGNSKSFTLSYLMDEAQECKGISPTLILGLEEGEMSQILLGLSANYPEFINATFTHDLENITLSQDKSSADVLKLF